MAVRAERSLVLAVEEAKKQIGSAGRRADLLLGVFHVALFDYLRTVAHEYAFT